MVNFLLYRAWLVKEWIRKLWIKQPRGRKIAIAWLATVALFLIVVMPWQGLQILAVVILFVSFIVSIMWALFTALDP